MKSKNVFCIVLILLAWYAPSFAFPDTKEYDGAWEIKTFEIGDYNNENASGVLIISDGYYSWALFEKENHAFIGAAGGRQKIGGATVEFDVMFHTINKDLIGKSIMFERKGGAKKWTLRSSQGISIELRKFKEKEESPLKGTWRITELDQNGSMVAMPAGDRKTLKLLSNQHFQWAAFNVATGEFFGTGGGSYTLQDGKYTENIEFFSRDNSRVGASLSFNYSVEDEGNSWHHRGLSSTGREINEIWSRED